MAAPVPLDRLPPTTAAYVIATAIIAGVTGYFIGQGSSLNLFKEKNEGWPNSYNVKVHSHSSDEEEDDSEEETEEEDEGNGEELASFKDNTEEVKLVLVVRMDLGMTKGMRFTQCFLRTC
jgi:PTH2 family peptidyl-tRNA hydrolase